MGLVCGEGTRAILLIADDSGECHMCMQNCSSISYCDSWILLFQMDSDFLPTGLEIDERFTKNLVTAFVTPCFFCLSVIGSTLLIYCLRKRKYSKLRVLMCWHLMAHLTLLTTNKCEF